ncbi:MAG: hypothetical protein S0880_05255 [Actinomycetota bacterium]|nr:hypothetical protein [Actinomycetota bacterium]
MARRRNRSVSFPGELDERIATAAAAEGLTVSAWLVRSAERELVIRAGPAAVADWEVEHGALTTSEMAEAREWAADVLSRAGAPVNPAPR